MLNGLDVATTRVLRKKLSSPTRAIACGIAGFTSIVVVSPMFSWLPL
jgi:hypothetical protein